MENKTDLDYICKSDPASDDAKRLSRIICTIGPASRDPSILEKMMRAGMNIARLNLSHGSHEYHAETIKNIRTAESNYANDINRAYYPLAIALDTKGREIRTGVLEGGGCAEIELKKGQTIKLTTDKAFADKGTKDIVFVNYENITKVLKVGSRIFVDDGLISLTCIDIKKSEVTCVVENGGMLGSRKGINLPGVPIDLPIVSETDKDDVRFGVEQNVDMIFLSFTPNAKAVIELKSILGDLGYIGKYIKVISKIENQQGIENLDEIIEASDGIMVERGDLGSEIPLKKLFLAQKSIIARCNKFGKPVICATQMLESMITKPRPTRAEISDVANAIFDGADCVMLSGETAKGEYPVECVATMAGICLEAEEAIRRQQRSANPLNQLPANDVDDALAFAAVQAASKSSAKAIFVDCASSETLSYLIYRYRPNCPIIMITPDDQELRQANLYRAIVPIWQPGNDDTITNIKYVIKTMNYGKSVAVFAPGDLFVVLTGFNEELEYIKTMRIHKI